MGFVSRVGGKVGQASMYESPLDSSDTQADPFVLPDGIAIQHQIFGLATQSTAERPTNFGPTAFAAPNGTDTTLTILEDAPRTLTADDFGFSDTDGDSLLAVEITTLPMAGTLTFNGVAVVAGASIPVASLPQLVFTPAPNANGTGYASFTFRVQDSGGTVGDNLDQSPNTISFDVTAVNDAPTVGIAPQSLSKVGGEFRVNTGIQGSQVQPVITSLASGGFVVTWSDPSRLATGTGTDAAGFAIKGQIYGANGAPVGSEFLVNTATAGEQVESTITVLTSGNFVVAWNDGSASGADASGSGIKAQMYDAAGTRIGSEFLVNTATTNTQQTPTITALTSGGFVVSWADGSLQSDDSSGSAIRAQLYNAAGGRIGTEFLVNSTTSGNQQAPAIAALASGGFVVSWTDLSAQGSDTSGSGIKAQIYNAAGAPVGGEFLVNSQTSGDQIDSTITGLASGGFVVSWTDKSGLGSDTSGWGIKAQIYDAAGARVGGEFLINTATAGTQEQPTIAALASGGFVVSWTDPSLTGGDASAYSIKAQLFDATGAKVGGEYLVNTRTFGSQIQPTVTELASGELVVSWVDFNGGNGDNSSSVVNAQILAFGRYEAAVEQVALSLKGGFAIADIDAGSNAVSATVSVGYGRIDVTAGTSGASVSGNGTGSVTITGTTAQILALLNSDATSTVRFTANTDTPPASTVLTLTVDDGGNSGTGGAQQATATSTISIVAINDAPTGTDRTIAIAEEAPRTLTAADFGFSDVEGNSFQAVRITTLPAAGSLTLNGVAVTAGQFIPVASLPNLVFTPAANVSGTGYASFTFQVQDNGTTTNGGVTLDPSANRITFDVTPVNDAPTVSILNAIVRRIGDELQVNTETASDQSQPSITTLTSGQFVIAWTDYSGADGEGSGIKARIVDATGAPIGDEIFVNTKFEYYQVQPTITALTSGGFVVSWVDYSYIEGAEYETQQIKAQVFNASGAPVGTELVVNSNGFFLEQPAVTGLASGGFVITWMDYIEEIKAQLFTAEGAPIAGEFVINSTTDGSQRYPTVTSLASGGFVVAWIDYSGAVEEGSGIRAQIYNAAGAPLGGELRINSTTTSNQEQPKIASLASGGFLVTWLDYSGEGGDTSGAGIKGRIFDASGEPVGDEFLVNTATSGSQSQPAITALTTGGFVVSWFSDAGADVKAQAFSATGARIGAEFTVNSTTSGNQQQPTITALADGRFAISWIDNSGVGGDNSGFGIRSQIFEVDPYAGTEQQTQSLKGGIFLGDIDAGSGTVTVTLSVGYGRLDVTAGTSGASVAGSGTGTVTLTGTIAQIQALLFNDATSSVTFTPNGDAPPASTTLTVILDDGGNTGGGALQASANVTITIAAVNDAPTGNDASRTILEDASYTFTTADFGFGDVDGNALAAVRISTLPAAGALFLDTDGAGGNAPVAVTAGQTINAVDIAAGYLTFVPVAGANGAPYGSFTFQVQDNGGTANGGVNLDQSPNTFTINVNDAPVLTGLSSSVTFLENTVNATPQIIDAEVSLVDAEGNFGGGKVEVIGLAPQDRIGVFNEGTGAGQIGVSGSDITYGGVVIGTATGGVGNQFTVTLNAAATSVAVDALIQQLTYANVSDTPIGSRGLTIRVTDSEGATGSQFTTINVTAQDDAPTAVADVVTTTESLVAVVNVLGNDTDVDGGPKTVVSVNGNALSTGQSTTLASGAVVTLADDGTLRYNPYGAFSALNTGSTGVDSFNYVLNGGSSATVSVTIRGVTQTTGSSGDDVTTSGGSNDVLDFSQGGNDTVSTGGGNDSIFFGAAFNQNDTVDGGDGSGDQIGLQGDYTGGNALTLGGNVKGIEVVALLAGFDYNVTALDTLLTAGQRMTIFGSGLGVGDNFTFDGSAETSGSFLIYGGLGTDILTTGGGNDGFQFAAGRFDTATDVINGGGGNDQVALNAFSGTISGANLISVETVVLLSGNNSIVIADDWTLAGQSQTVFGSALSQSAMIDGSAETDGRLALYGGSGADVLTGGALADQIVGGGGNDTIRGGLGADFLRGDGGADTFVYGSAAESTGATRDTLVGFDASVDKIDLPTAITAIDAAITVGTLSAGSFDSDLSAALAGLGANHAITFTADQGDLAGRIFLVADTNGVAGYQAGQDAVFELVAPAQPIIDPAPFI